jgi:hypothetical protein
VTLIFILTLAKSDTPPEPIHPCTYIFSCSFTFDLKPSPCFEIVTSILYAAIYTSIVLNTAYDAILFEIGYSIVGNFKVLQMELKMAVENRDKKLLKLMIDTHNKIEECFTKLNKIFAAAIFNRLLTSAISICVLGFQLIVSHNFLGTILPVVYLILVWLRVLVYSYLGQIITDEVISF